MISVNAMDGCFIMTLSEDEIKRRVVDCLQKRTHQDMSISELANSVGINRNTMSKYLAVFCAEGIIIRSRMVGKAKFFSLPPTKETVIEMLTNHLQYQAARLYKVTKDEANELIRCGKAKAVILG